MPSRLFCIRISYWAWHPHWEGFEIARYVLFNAIREQSWHGATIAKTRTRRHSGPPPVYDKKGNCIIQGKSIASDDDTLQDGQGDPNLSAMSPPLPDCLVEPKHQEHETGFHVITSGTTIGISPFMCIFFLGS